VAGWRRYHRWISRAGGVRICEARVHSPMLPLVLFAQKTSGSESADVAAVLCSRGGLFFICSLIQVQDFSATAAGASFLPSCDHFAYRAGPVD